VFDVSDEDGTLGALLGFKAERTTMGGTLLFAETESLIEDDGSARFFGRARVRARF